MLKYTLIIILHLLFLNCGAQNSIQGTISDTYGKPLVGATIFINELNKGTISTIGGYYKLENLPSGSLKIQYAYLGYATQLKLISFSGELEIVDIVMQPTAIEADEVVISGGYNATQHENAVKIEVLKLKDERLGYKPNFMEMITQIPGVDMISKGSGVSKPVIRGLSMNDILVLNNGVRFENYQYSSHHPLGIDEFGIQDIEVIKGPASLLYGSDAIGGVLNFIKEKPAPQGQVIGDYNLQLFSNSLGMNNNVGIRGASKKLFAGLRIGQKSHADYLQGGGNFVPNSRFNEWSIKSNVGFTGKKGTYKLFYDVNNQDLGLVEDEAILKTPERGRKIDIFYQNLISHLLSSQNRLFFGKLKLDVDMAYQNTGLTHFGEENVNELQMGLATLTYETKLHLPSFQSTEIILGFQGMNQSNTNLNNREIKLLPDAQTNNYSVFGMAQRAFFKKLRLQSGIRYDYKTLTTIEIGSSLNVETYRPALQNTYGSFSGSLGAIYNFTDEFLVRTNLAASYRTPNLAELTSKGQHEARYEVGNSNLIPENAYEADLSIHYHKPNFTFDMAGFYNLLNHYIYISPTRNTSTSGLPIYAYYQDNSFLFGGETGVHFHPSTLKWLHFMTTFSTVTGKKNNGEYLPFIPSNKLKMQPRIEVEKLLFFSKATFEINYNFTMNQEKASPEETTTAGYSIVDINAGGNIKLGNQKITIGIGVLNLLDNKYIDHLSLLKEVNYYNPGRNIVFSLKIPFGLE